MCVCICVCRMSQSRSVATVSDDVDNKNGLDAIAALNLLSVEFKSESLNSSTKRRRTEGRSLG